MIGSTTPTRRWQPVVTYVLIGANVIAYLWSARWSGSLVDNQASETFARLCLSYPATALGWWWTTLTSGFLHFGPVHLLINMYSLWALGQTVEGGLGRARYAVVYVLSLLGGSAAVLWFGLGPGAFTAGASGAVFGIMGAELVLLLRLRFNPTMLLVVIGANLVMSFTVPGISLYGHLGGLVSGLLIATAMLYGPALLPAARRTASRAATVGWVGTAAVGLVILGAIVARFADVYGTRILTTVPVG